MAVRDSIKFDNILDRFDEIINIFKFYYYSSLRRENLNDLALLSGENFKQFELLKNILLKHNYEILVCDLESNSYGNSKTAKKAFGYVDFIKTPRFVFHFTFLQDVVDKLRPLSLEFQKDELLVCHIPSKLSELNLNDNNELLYKDTVLEKRVGRRAPEIEHSPEGYKKHHDKLLGEFIDAILNCLIKGTQNSPNYHFCKWGKYLTLHLDHLLFVIQRN